MKQKRVNFEHQGQGLGDVWTFYALDQASKLVISYRVGNGTPTTRELCPGPGRPAGGPGAAH